MNVPVMPCDRPAGLLAAPWGWRRPPVVRHMLRRPAGRSIQVLRQNMAGGLMVRQVSPDGVPHTLFTVGADEFRAILHDLEIEL